MAEETRKYCHRPITLTPFGVDCQRFRPLRTESADPADFVVGTVKPLEEKYGIEYLIRSFAAVAKRYQNRRILRLIITGTGSLEKAYKKLAGELGIGDMTQSWFCTQRQSARGHEQILGRCVRQQ